MTPIAMATKFDTIWWRGLAVTYVLVSINEVTLRRARLVLGWVTVTIHMFCHN